MFIDSKWNLHPTLITGLWKFNSNVTLEQLQELAVEWKRSGWDARSWDDFYIRSSGKHGALALGFSYRMQGIYNPDTLAQQKDPGKVQAEFFHKYTDLLKKRFGNDFIGYDLSSPTWTLEEW